MAEVFEFLFYRGIERWMVVVGGLIFGYFGYKLFLYGVDQGHGKLDAENKLFKITFSGSGPGLFFMAFGALILMSSVYSTGMVTHESLMGKSSQNSATAPSNASDSSPTAKTTVKFTAKLGVSDCDHILPSKHDDVRETLEVYGVVNKELKALATAMKSLSDEQLKSLLPAIYNFLCE